MAPLDELRLHMCRVAPGTITDTYRLAAVLGSAWADLEGSTRELGMKGEKLFGRMEAVEWNPPLLTFRIERHGGIVCGSTRAELQTWRVNVDVGTAEGSEGSFRQLYPRDARLNVTRLVDQVIALIENRQTHDWLKWVSGVRVRVLIAKIIPTTKPQTTTGRRKRFRAELEPRLEVLGFKRPPDSAPNTYERIP